MKRFVLNGITILIFSLVPVMAVTFMGDASALFYKSIFYSDLEEEMEAHKLIEVQSNHDERIFKKTLIKANSGKNFSSVIFGSSRVMLITSKKSLNLGPINGQIWTRGSRIYGVYYTKILQNILESIWEHPGKDYLWKSETQKNRQIGTYPHSHIAT